MPLADINFAIQQGGFLAARCDDTPQRLNLRTVFTYNDSNTQTVNAFQPCT